MHKLLTGLTFYFLLGSFCLWISPSAIASSATAIGFAAQSVEQSIKIEKISDLQFGNAPQGDGPKQISPGSSETLENASFEVTGEAHRSFFIILPFNGTVEMSWLGPDEETADARPIPVNHFRSHPALFGHLGATGRTRVYVGATRSALHPRQKPGQYLGQFALTVVY